MGSNLDDELGVRLQEEHKALVQLSKVLKEHIAAMPSHNIGNWLDGLRTAFDRLVAHIQRCIQIKVKDGYLEAILTDRPNLASQVEDIKSEHPQLLGMGEGIRRDMATIKPEERLLVGDACARVQRFMAIVAQHEQRETMIVMFAFNQDLGSH